MGAVVVAALLFGVPAVDHANLAAVLLAVVVLTPLALTDTVQSVGVAAPTLKRSAAAARRLADVLATPPVSTAPVHPKPLRHSTFGPTVTLHDVSARWPGADHDALTHLDLTLEPGKRVVVLGPSGSGKSTVLAPHRSGSTAGPFQAGSASGSPWPGHFSPTARSCSPTNQPPTWTPRPQTPSPPC